MNPKFYPENIITDDINGHRFMWSSDITDATIPHGTICLCGAYVWNAETRRAERVPSDLMIDQWKETQC